MSVASENKKLVLELLSEAELELCDLFDLLEAMPGIESLPITRVLKALPDATTEMVNETIRLFDLRYKSPTSDRLLPKKLSEVSSDELNIMHFVVSKQGGLKTAPHDGWPFWAE